MSNVDEQRQAIERATALHQRLASASLDAEAERLNAFDAYNEASETARLAELAEDNAWQALQQMRRSYERLYRSAS